MTSARKRQLIESAIKKIVYKMLSENKRHLRRKPIQESIDFESPDVISKIKSAAAKLDREIQNSSEPILLVDANRGIYVYSTFAKEYLGIKMDPNDENYMDDIESLEQEINDLMKNGYLMQDDDLFLYPNDYESEDSY